MCVTQEREVQAGGEKGFFVCLFFVQSLAGAMVARLPTEQEAVGSSPTSGCDFLRFRYGVVGNMSGSHPVASGSIPGIGCLLFAFLAQSAERCANNFSLDSGPRERFVWKRNGRRFDPGRKLFFFVCAPVV